jgi:Flp pilus assembly protein TadD
MQPSVRPIAWVCVALSLPSVACTQRHPPSPTKPHGDVAAAPRSSGPSVVKPAQDLRGTTTSGDAGTRSREEQERAKAYEVALGRGRRATAARKWSEATEAFSEALAIEPRDGRAISERGYAHLLAGDLEAARKDLERARRWPTDSDVLASTLHNLGMLEERSGNPAEAEELKAQAKRIRKNAQLAKTGAMRCPIEEAEVPTPELFDSFKDVAAALENKYGRPLDEENIQDVNEDEAAAQYRLTQSTDPKVKVVIVGQRDPNNGPLHLAVRRQDGKIAIFWEIARHLSGLCGGNIGTRVTTTELAHVVVDEDELMRGMCDGETVVHNCCVSGNHHVRHYIYDLEHDRMVMELVETLDESTRETEPRVEVLLQDGQVAYIGAGCDHRRPFGP